MEQIKDYPQHPHGLWSAFYDLTRVPRPSKKEEKVREFLKNEAKKYQLKFVEDSVGNIIIYVPGKGGLENRPPVMIQSHMDMVCDKTPEKVIDFENDPIEIFVKDGKIMAKDTTLGADNGFGVAASLALFREKNLKHPPLELLFTVDEETGLHGAKNIDPAHFKARRGFNIDTEEWGSLYIGCAGGVDYDFNGTYKTQKPNGNFKPYRLTVGGLKGGHSGCDIHLSRGNSLKILTEILWSLRQLPYELASIVGGKAHNIIPRDAYAQLFLDAKDASAFEKAAKEKILELKKYLPQEDHTLDIQLTQEKEIPATVFEGTERNRFLSLVTLFPHGAYSYNWSSEEPLVNFSSNMAQVRFIEGKVYLQTSVRFLDPAETVSVDHKLESLATLFSLEMRKGVGYPSWKPEFHNNELIDLCSSVFKELFGGTPKVKAIHAGLECGIIKDKLGDMKMISIGPDLTCVHSPTEALDIETSNKFWTYFITLLERM